MLAKRIIPCLDVKNGRVVKGTEFLNLRDAGDPVELGAFYDREGADELVFLDITASHERRKTVVEMVARVAEQVFIPYTVGGGITSTQDMREILLAGADKTAINTHAVQNPRLISEGAELFGSQCVVLAIDARRRVKDNPAAGGKFSYTRDVLLPGLTLSLGRFRGRNWRRGDTINQHGPGWDQRRV